MGRVTVTVHDQAYDLLCADGEERRLGELARLVDGRVRSIAAGLDPRLAAADEARLLLMACLLFADELADARAGQAPGDAAASATGRLAAELEAVAARIEAVAADLDAG